MILAGAPELRRTTLATVVSAMDAVCAFTLDGWIGQVGVPTAVVIMARDRSTPGRSVPDDSGVTFATAGRGQSTWRQRASL